MHESRQFVRHMRAQVRGADPHLPLVRARRFAHWMRGKAASRRLLNAYPQVF
jgi:hypothetical protein